MNLEKDFEINLEKLGYKFQWCRYHDIEEMPISEAEALHISWYEDNKDNYTYIGKTMKILKKKEMTIEWVLSKLELQKEFISLTKILKDYMNNGGLNYYPASYGFGVVVIYNRDKKKHIDKIAEFLTSNNIQFTNEYSDAMWVYRFKISKAKDNIERIKKAVS